MWPAASQTKNQKLTTAKVAVAASQHEDQSGCGHVPRHQLHLAPCFANGSDVLPCKGIVSSRAYSFLFLSTSIHFAMRAYSCWCNSVRACAGGGKAQSLLGGCHYWCQAVLAQHRLSGRRSSSLWWQQQVSSSAKSGCLRLVSLCVTRARALVLSL